MLVNSKNIQASSRIIKTIGIIGGLSPESTIVYYKLINNKFKKIFGGHNSAPIIIVSVNFQEIVSAIYTQNWEKAAVILIDAAKKLEAAGADFIIIACNTLHKIAKDIEKSINIPLLHILKIAGDKIKNQFHFDTISMFGTKFTMQEDFHKKYLFDNFRIKCIDPSVSHITLINEIIFNELCHGIVNKNSEKIIKEIILDVHEKGAQAILLGCTEMHFLINQETCEVPILDVTYLHAESAINFSLTQQ